MWTLIVILMNGGSMAATETTLERCQQAMLEVKTDIKTAYCKSNVGNDVVLIVMDGRSIPSYGAPYTGDWEQRK